MTQRTTEEIYGNAVWNDNDFVVRVIRREDGCHVFIHRRDKQGEHVPLGYLLGTNAAHLEVQHEQNQSPKSQ